MLDKIIKLLNKYQEIIIYLIVGVMTTVVSWGACFVVEHFWLDASISWQNNVINSIGWIVGVLFAYPLNRKWVFKSTNPHIIKEFTGFATSRVSTWVLDIVVMWLTVNVLNWDYWISKIFISSVLVTILNYVFSKILVFGRKQTTSEE